MYRRVLLFCCLLTASFIQARTSQAGNISPTANDWTLTMFGDIDLGGGNKPTAAANKTIRLLSIGNSFSQDAQEWIYNIAKAAGYEDIIIANLYWGGCDLKTHAENAKNDFGGDGSHYEYQLHKTPSQVVTRDKSIKGALQSEYWDYVTLQQVSQDAGMENTFTNGDLDYLTKYVKQYAKNPNVKIGWHMTWAYQQDSNHSGFANYNNNQSVMYDAIVHCTRDIVMANPDIKFVFPAGTAIQNLRTSFIGDNLTRDGYHMSYNLGRYVVGLTWIYKLCEMQGNPFPEDITYTPSATEVPDFYLPAIREAVKNAVVNPYEVTPSSYNDIAKIIDLHLENYARLDWGPQEGLYWKSAENTSQTLGNDKAYIASKLLTKDDLPTGTVIQVDEDYRYRPEGWASSTTNMNPLYGVVTTPTVILTDSWWGNDKYRAFNVSRKDNSSLIGKTAEVNEHFRIYLPKALGNGGDFYIVNKNSGKPLAIKDDSGENLATICQDATANSTIWSFEYVGNGYYYIINKYTGKVLDVPGGSTEENTQPIQYSRNNAKNQQWNVIDLGDGEYRISPKCAPKLALDVAGSSMSDGSKVVQWTYKGSDNEIFYLKPAETLVNRIAAVAQGGTFQLDYDYEDAIQIAQGKDVTIDLNGHKLTSKSTYVIRNNGRLRIIDTAGNGSIELEGNSDSNLETIVNEATGVLNIESGTISSKVTGGSAIAVGIHNKGRIESISGGDVIAWTKGNHYAYGLWNEGGTVENITDGWFYGAGLADYQNGNNSLAINNAKGTVNISGGIFIGTTRTDGKGYGIRSAGTANLSGGTFYGSNSVGFEWPVSTQDNGVVNYLNEAGNISNNTDGALTVLERNDQYFVTFVAENEEPIATYILNNNGSIVKRMGHIQDSYDVYFRTKTEKVRETDLSRYGQNTILYVNTGDKREVMMFLGSSVTYGAASWGNSWADYLNDEHGDELIISKRAVSGTTLLNTDGGSYVARMKSQISHNAKIDHLIVQLSTNDAGRNLTLGTLSSKDEFHSGNITDQTIIGAMEHIIAYAKETWGCKVSFWSGPKYNNDKYVAMRNALINEIQPKWGIGVIDFWDWWTPANGDMNDDIHPKSQGYKKMVPIAYNYLKTYDAQVIDQYINEIGNVSDEGTAGERIEKARFVYENTIESAKSEVANYYKLENAEWQYASIFDGTRKIENTTEVTVLAGPDGSNNESYNRLFDGKIGSKSGTWHYAGNAYLWKFEKPTAIKYYYLATGNDNLWWWGRNPKTWKLYGSNDSDNYGNGTWTEVDNVTNDDNLPNVNYYAALYKVDSPSRYQYYKLEIPAQDAEFLQLSEMTMYEDVNALPYGPATIRPFVHDGNVWLEQNTVSIKAGENFSLGPQANHEGTWYWTGPNGFASSSREFTITNATTAQSGYYVVTFTSVNGTQTTATFTVNIIDTTIDTTTGIEQVSTPRQHDEHIYDIHGQSVSSAKKKGIYIRNKRKFIVK